MPISVRQTNQALIANNTTSGNTLSVTLSSSPNAGNLMISFGEGSDGANITAATGFTLIDSNSNSNAFLDQYRVVIGGDSATQPVVTSNTVGNQGLSAIIYEITGQASSAFINQHNLVPGATASSLSANNTVTTSSITPTVNGCLIIAGCSYNSSTTTGAVTVNGSFAIDQKAAAAGTANGDSCLATASFVQNVAASVSATFTNANALLTTTCQTFILAIAPGAQGNAGAGAILLMGVG